METGQEGIEGVYEYYDKEGKHTIGFTLMEGADKTWQDISVTPKNGDELDKTLDTKALAEKIRNRMLGETLGGRSKKSELETGIGITRITILNLITIDGNKVPTTEHPIKKEAHRVPSDF